MVWAAAPARRAARGGMGWVGWGVRVAIDRVWGIQASEAAWVDKTLIDQRAALASPRLFSRRVVVFFPSLVRMPRLRPQLEMGRGCTQIC